MKKVENKHRMEYVYLVKTNTEMITTDINVFRNRPNAIEFGMDLAISLSPTGSVLKVEYKDSSVVYQYNDSGDHVEISLEEVF